MNNFELTSLIRAARQSGFTINLDNYEIEIYEPGATVSAAYKRNDPAQVKQAVEDIRAIFREQARAEQNAISRVRSL